MPVLSSCTDDTRSSIHVETYARRGPSAPELSPYIPPRRATVLVIGVLALIASGAGLIVVADDGPSAEVVAPALGSLESIADQLDVTDAWAAGITGAGVNVAVVDTGVAPVNALRHSTIVAVDMTDESSDAPTAGVDAYGHGTHLAGIIAGNDAASGFRGLAPDAGIVSVKVAGEDGSVTPSNLISGIDWVVDHADEYDVRVLTLAFNAEDISPTVERALLAAVERAWDAGIVVVGAAGNSGEAGLVAPANSRSMIAVAAVEATGTGFDVADFSTTGDGVRNPDVAAPGAHVESLRAPGSTADREHPEGYVDAVRFLGTGTSQSAAVVSALAALAIQAEPGLTNDEVRRLLLDAATPVGSPEQTGAGVPSASAMLALLATEFGWSGLTWSGLTWSGHTWSGHTWSGHTWSGHTWSGHTWSGHTWA